jgi:hypothetical protein
MLTPTTTTRSRVTGATIICNDLGHGQMELLCSAQTLACASSRRPQLDSNIRPNARHTP